MKSRRAAKTKSTYAHPYGRQPDDLQIRGQEYRPPARNDCDVHAQTAVRGQRLGNARSSESVAGRDQPVLRQGGLRRAERAWPLLHRWAADPRLGVMRALRPDHELLSASGAGLRSTDQPGLFPAQSLGLLPDSDVFAEPAGKARRVPFAGSLLQSLPGLRRDADGRP